MLSYRPASADLFNHSLSGYSKGFGSVYVVQRNGAFLVRCNSTVLSRLICTNNGKRYWKNIDFILMSPTFAAPFIAGFWDADGGVFHETNGTPRVHLYNSNLFLLDKVADALQSLYGIETIIYKRTENKYSPASKIKAQKDRFDLYVRAVSNRPWRTHICSYMLLPWKRPIKPQRSGLIHTAESHRFTISQSRLAPLLS
jgi:hypothetical protein